MRMFTQFKTLRNGSRFVIQKIDFEDEKEEELPRLTFDMKTYKKMAEAERLYREMIEKEKAEDPEGYYQRLQEHADACEGYCD